MTYLWWLDFWCIKLYYAKGLLAQCTVLFQQSLFAVVYNVCSVLAHVCFSQVFKLIYLLQVLTYLLNFLLFCGFHFKPCLAVSVAVSHSGKAIQAHFHLAVSIGMWLPCCVPQTNLQLPRWIPNCEFHCCKNSCPLSYYIFSSNGTFVNGEKIGKVFSFWPFFLFLPFAFIVLSIIYCKLIPFFISLPDNFVVHQLDNVLLSRWSFVI